MKHYAGIDVSLELSSVCVVDETGKIVCEAKVASDPAALAAWFGKLGFAVERIGLEAGPLSQWLHAGLTAAGQEVVLLETRHVKAALSAMIVKTDRKDARGIAQLLRMGWYRPVHVKALAIQEQRALLVARKQLQRRLLDIELSMRGILRGFGLKVGTISKGQFQTRIQELVECHPTLEGVTGPMLEARASLREQFAKLHRAVLVAARGDEVCGRLMTVPSVGPVVALTYRSAIDEPGRFAKSKTVGPHFGLTPRVYQSGETEVSGHISRFGDAMVRAALYEAANVMLSREVRFSSLKRWALEVAKRRGLKRAKVALARKLAVVLHRIWVDGTEFRWSKDDGKQAARPEAAMA